MTVLTAVRERSTPIVRAVPVWAWVAVLVAVSAGIRFQLARRVAAPWIMVDELIYSELAKSIAAGGDYLVRDQPTGAYGYVYPLLLAPAYRAFTAVPDVYEAAKAINAVVMSLAAVPAYLLARRVLPPVWSFAAAVIALALPAFVYSGTLMTENAFYPAFLGAVLALVLALERPTVGRQLLVLVLCALAYLVRTQAVALVPAVLLAPVLLDRIERRPWRDLSRFAVLYGTVAGGAVLAVAAQLARGRGVAELLGAYRAAAESDYSAGGVLRWLLYHVAGLDLAVGVAPFAALLLLALLVRRLDGPARAFVVAAVSVSFWLVLEVAAFASQASVQRIEERNLFYVFPLFAIALLLWIERGAPRPPVPLAAAAVAAAGLPAALPFTRLIGPPAVSDTFFLLPWWWVQDHWVDGSQVRLVAFGCAAAAVLVFALAPRAVLPVLPLLLAAWFAVVTASVLNGVHGVHNASVGSLWAGIKNPHADWIDRAVGSGAEVAAVNTGNAAPYTIWENEFFNRSVGTVYRLGGELPGGLPETPVTVGRDGVVRREGGGLVRARYVLSDGSFTPDGAVVAQDARQGVAVYRTDGVVRTSTLVDGLYPHDTWSGREVEFRRLRCDGGRLRVTLASDPSLFTLPQTVTARVHGQVVGRTSIPPDATRTLTVPLRPGADGSCAVRFTVGRTAVPARVLPGSGDTRELGAHFLGFAYRG